MKEAALIKTSLTVLENEDIKNIEWRFIVIGWVILWVEHVLHGM